MPSMDDELDGVVRTQRQDLELFVDRHPYVREFVSTLHQVPREGQILFFHGVGGIGKSLLLRYLREHACKILPEGVFRHLEVAPDDQYREQLESYAGKAVPWVMLDFSAPPDKAYGNPQMRFDGVLMLRRMLGRHGFSFPTFDFAIVTHGHTRGYPKEKIAEYLPSGEAGLVGDLLKVFVTESRLGAVAMTAYEHISARHDADVRRWWQKRKVAEDALSEILLLDAETELVRELPRFLAQDVNEELHRRAERNEPSTLCMFFDTHDAFWAEQSFGAPASRYADRDEWVRRLLRRLDRERVVVVFTGRDRPAWAAAEHAPIPERFVRTVSVGDLSAEDANLYLRQRKIEPARLRQRVMRALKSEVGIHPLSLGLVADVLERSGEAGERLDSLFEGDDLSFSSIGPQLLERLLRYLSADERYAVSALGACRSFDEDLFNELGTALRFHATHPTWLRLTNLSFAVQVRGEAGDERWKVHTLLRTILLRSSAPSVQRTHEFLAELYKSRSMKTGDQEHIEYLFHRFHTPGCERATVEEWLRSLDQARESGDEHAVLRLLGLQDELELTTWDEQARLVLVRAASYSSQGRGRDAARLLRRMVGEPGSPAGPDACLRRAELLLQLGWVLRYLTDGGDAVAAFEQALSLLSAGPASFDHMRGRLLFGLSGVYSDAGDHERCVEIRAMAVSEYESALSRTQSPPMRWISDASSGLSSHAAALRKVRRLPEARVAAERSVVVAEEALVHAPEDTRALHNLQYACFVCSQVLLDLSGPTCREALDYADRSLAVERERHRLRGADPRTIRTQPLLQVSRALVGCGRAEVAAPLVEEAIAAAMYTTEFRPRERGGHLSLALAWRLRMELAQSSIEWTLFRERAALAFRAALELAPGYVPAREMLDEVDDVP